MNNEKSEKSRLQIFKEQLESVMMYQHDAGATQSDAAGMVLTLINILQDNGVLKDWGDLYDPKEDQS